MKKCIDCGIEVSLKVTKRCQGCWAKSILGKKKPTRSKEHCLKISEFNKGRIPWNKGKKGIKHTRGFKLSEETKKRMSLSKIGKKRLPLSMETRQKMRLAKLNNPVHIFKDTKIELKIEAELIKRNINYQKQVPLCKIAIVDFYLPEYRTVIQADGCFWHGCPIHNPYLIRTKERDANQDSILTFNNFKVFRFWQCEIDKSVEKCIDKISII